MNYLKIFLVAALSSVLMVSCNEDSGLDETTVSAPTITSFEPTTGALGDEIMVYGTDLSSITSATIGGGEATIKYRIDATIAVLEVTNESRDGAITVTNSTGTATSSSSFDVDHTLVPTVTDTIIPVQTDEPTEDADEYDNYSAFGIQVVLEGSDLNAVSAVMFGDDTEATIILQREDELVFEVPLLDYSETLALSLSYYNGTADASVSLGQFHVLVLVPLGYDDYVPSTLTKYDPFTLEGTNMDLFNSFYVESSDGTVVALTIMSQSTTSISVDINTAFYDEEFTGDLIAIYNVDKEVTLYEDFVLYANPYEHRYIGKSDMFIEIRSQISVTGTANSFMDLSDLIVYEACAVESGNLLSLIDVVPYHKGLEYMQLRSPHNMTATVKNYRCEDTTTAASSFEGIDEFYKKYTYFWVLDSTGETYPEHKTFIEAFMDGASAEDDETGVAELTAEYFESIGITLDTSDLGDTYYGPSVYRAGNYTSYNGYSTADVENFPYMIVYSVDDDKYGLIKLTGSIDDGVSYLSSLDFSLWY
ncbi:MAG: IPT/TIG domain-containing protein [Rikenellaceae bacterium]